MKLIALALLLAAAAPSPEIRHFRYQRAVQNTPTTGQTCAVLDPAVFAHAAPQLSDVRLYRGTTETPYVIRTASAPASVPQEIALLNLGKRGNQVVFDAQMPETAYSDITLELHALDFIATVHVSGSRTQDASTATQLGDYTIFDLSRQKLGRSTVLHLPHSDFRFLHFRIDGPVAPENFTGLTAGAVSASQPSYQVIASSSQVTQKPHQTELVFTVPQHTPVDRIVFAPGSQPVNFSRAVQVTLTPPAAAKGSSAEPQPSETFHGNLLRIHRVQEGHRLDQEELSVNAPVREFDIPMTWLVVIENGDDAPISIASVRLEMVERHLCFDAAGAGYTLYYGDPVLEAPKYDYAALFVEQGGATRTVLGPEALNAAYQMRADSRPFTERHPVLLWMALALAIVVLGIVAIRTARETKPTE